MKKQSVVVLAVGLISTSALGAEAWDCKFKAFDGPPGISSHVTIRLNNDKLDWMLQPFDIPVPATHITPPIIQYRVLENNNIGIVAVSSRARIDKDFGILISSETVAIDKSSGALHAGIVGTNGVHDNLSGTCRPK
jgi:hypothetical protein